MAKNTAKKEEKKLTKDELITELVARGFDEADLVDLEEEELVAQLKADDLEGGAEAGEESENSDEPEEEAGEELLAQKEEQKKASDKAGASSGKFVDVIKGSEYIRTYSLEDHGKDFMKLAEEFVSKDPRYSLAKDGQVNTITVSFRIENKKTGVYTPVAESFTDREKAIAFKNTQPGNVKVSVTFK